MQLVIVWRAGGERALLFFSLLRFDFTPENVEMSVKKGKIELLWRSGRAAAGGVQHRGQPLLLHAAVRGAENVEPPLLPSSILHPPERNTFKLPPPPPHGCVPHPPTPKPPENY